jgi:hypothetical protein
MNRNLILSLSFLFITASFFSCSKEYSLETGAFTTAKGTLHDNSGNCYTSTVKGTYKTGVTLKDSNYVEVQLNVTTAGNYSISSDTINGIYFKDAGIFSTTGVKTIKLLGSGKPLLNQNSSFLIGFDSTYCSFTVFVEDSTRTGGGTGGGGTAPNYLSDSAWYFSEGARNYHGFIDTAFVFDTTVAGQSFRILQIQGATASAGDSVLLIGITFPGGVITPGTYTSNSASVFRFLGSFNDTDTVYSATFLTPTVSTTVIITSYNTTTKIIQGTFSGTAKNKTGNTVTITGGKFEAKLN